MPSGAKTVLVTGGTRGLGAGIVKALLAERAKLIVLSRTAGDRQVTPEDADVVFVQGDITDRVLASRCRNAKRD